MSEEDRDKWNRRYLEDSHRKTNPVDLLEAWIPRVPVGKALDVACGKGRNAFLMARAGFEVDAIDISAEGLRMAREEADSLGLDINWIEHDLDQAYDFDRDYSLIVVLWYVDLDLIARLCDCLAPGGFLVSQQHLLSGDDVIGPRSREFRVAPGALRNAASGLEILLYEEAIEPTPEGDTLASARLVARKS